MIEFFDDRNCIYRFEHAFFSWGHGRQAPPDIPGCYMLLDPNCSMGDGIGTHTVLYVGKTARTIRERMVELIDEKWRFKAVGRWIRRPYRVAQYEVLFVPNGEGCDAHFARWEWERYPDPLIRLEQRLKFLFVPIARCEEHLWSINAGRAAGKRLTEKEMGDFNWL